MSCKVGVHSGLLASALLASACAVGPGSPSVTNESGEGSDGKPAESSSGEETTSDGESTSESTESGSESTESSGDTSTSDTTETETGSDPLPDSCACIVDEVGDTNQPPALPTCNQPSCPTIYATSFVFMVDVSDPEALDCALTALRDRTPGQLEWNMIVQGDALDIQHGYVSINDDGSAIARSWYDSDVDFIVSDAAYGELKPPTTFDACLQSSDDGARFNCIVTALASTDAVCDEGWIYYK